MSDFDLISLPDLLAQLDNQHPTDDAPEVLWPLLRFWNEERAECAAAIRALVAERDIRRDRYWEDVQIAVAAEREACAKVCDEEAAAISAEEPEQEEAIKTCKWLAKAIRSRGTP